MAKTKKVPTAKAAGFTDKSGYALAVGDQVRYEVSTSPNNGREAILVAIHERDTDTLATVEFCFDSRWQATPAAPAFSENLVFLGRAAFAVGERARVAYEDNDNYTGREGRVARILPNAPFADIVHLEFGDAQLEDCEFQATDLLRTAMAEPEVAESVPATPKAEPNRGPSFTDIQAGVAANKAGLRLVPLASIVVTTNTRTVFDDTALAELAESVKAHGILQPVVLRPYAPEAGKYELVAGGRRYRAAQVAGLAELPATVRNLTDREFLEVQLLENLQRVDVRPADEATAFSKLLKNDFSAEEVALKVGKPVKFVLQRAKLASLIPFWFEALQEGRLLLVSANELARLPAHSQVLVKKSFDNSTYASGYPVRDISGAIESKVTRNLEKAPWDKADAYLVPSAGACTGCPKRSGAQGLLFESQDGPNLCLDGTCFASKQVAFANLRVKQLTHELGKAPLLASSNYYLDEGQKEVGVIASRDWYQSHEGAVGAVAVLMVDGSDAGQVKHVRLTGMAAMKEGRAGATDAQKAEDAARIRKDRLKKAHRTALAEALTVDLPLHLNNDGPAAHATLAHFIYEELSGRAGQKLEYLRVNWGWEPTDEQSDTGWNKRNEQGRTPWAHYVLSKVAELTLSQKVYLYFTLKVRHRMDHEYEDLQFSIASLAGIYDEVAAEAEKSVQQRYYSKGKKQEVANG